MFEFLTRWLRLRRARSSHRRKRTKMESLAVGLRPAVEQLESRELLTGSGLPRPDHVVIVIEENRTFAEIQRAHPSYITSLEQSGALFTNSHAITHPSQPNYLALFSGSTQGVFDYFTPTQQFAGPDLGSELIAAGFTFAGYSEGLPSVGYTGSAGRNYARWHNPWVNFSDLPASTNRPFSSFPTDFNNLPTVSFVIPNLKNDMHDGSIKKGDAWLRRNIDPYAQWARTHNSLLIVTWDENDFIAPENQIPTIFVGPMVTSGQYSENIDHYNVLRTIEDMYGLSAAGASASATAITDVFAQPLRASRHREAARV